MKKKPTQLELDTAAYFANMSEEEARADRELEAALAGCASGVDFNEIDEE